MTGPEHFKEAERLLSTRGKGSQADVERAKVHAALALAAAVTDAKPPGTTYRGDTFYPFPGRPPNTSVRWQESE